MRYRVILLALFVVGTIAQCQNETISQCVKTDGCFWCFDGVGDCRLNADPYCKDSLPRPVNDQTSLYRTLFIVFLVLFCAIVVLGCAGFCWFLNNFPALHF